MSIVSDGAYGGGGGGWMVKRGYGKLWLCGGVAGGVRAAGATASGRRAALRSMTRPAPCLPALTARSVTPCFRRHSTPRDN